MLKDNRPYSVENGEIDGQLITDATAETIIAVGDWIRKNVRKSNRILPGRTSYGLKHLLEKDTGIYLTNNQFKDALWLVGYKPVNTDELNWRYRIELVRNINDNPNPFFRWIKKHMAVICTLSYPCSDLAKEILEDFEFPIFAEHDLLRDYFDRRGACSAGIDAFEYLWEMYERENH